MKAVILAAGEGVRLRPFTYRTTKVMIPLANRPILQYVVDALREAGVREVVMVVGYKKEHVMEYFEDGDDFGVSIEYVFQPKPLGTAHALSLAEDLVGDELLMVPGDNVIDASVIRDALKAERNTVIATLSDRPSVYGVLRLSGRRVIAVEEKPHLDESALVSTGIFRFGREVFDYIRRSVEEDGDYTITGTIRHMIRDSRLFCRVTEGTWVDAVYPWDLIHVNRQALSWVETAYGGRIEENVVIRGAVEIGDGTVIMPGTYIEGPTSIGKNVMIGPNSVIRASSIGDGAEIGPITTVEESLIMDEVIVGGGSYVSHTAVGCGTVIGPRFTAYPGEAVKVIGSRVFRIRDVGALIADDVWLGAGVTVDPGVMIAAGCRVEPARRVAGDVLERRAVL